MRTQLAIIFILNLVFSSHLLAASTDFLQMCNSQYKADLSIDSDLQLQKVIFERVSKALVELFNSSSIVIQVADVDLESIIPLNHQIAYNFQIATASKTYHISATITDEEFGVSTSNTIWNVSAKTNEITNSIGQVLAAPTEVTCSGSKLYNNTISLYNIDSGHFIKQISISPDSTDYDYNAVGTYTFGI